MRVRSLTELAQFLDDDLSWRKRELTTLKFMLGRHRGHETVLLLRAAVCVLYAHWEGFVKAAATTYVSFVATRGLRYRDLAPNFVALGLRSEISLAGQSDRPTVHTELTRKLILGLSEPANIDWEHSINTRSNLNTRTLQDILCILGLDDDHYTLKKQLLDQRLLENRNRVAHGQRVEIEIDEYYALHDEVIQLLQNFRSDVENAAATGAFRRNRSLGQG